MSRIIILFSLSFLLSQCSPKTNDNNNPNQEDSTAQEVSQPIQKMNPVSFDADSAYFFVSKQVSFGPRVPGSLSQTKTSEWFINQLNQYCDTVYVQKGNLVNHNSESIPFINVIGSFNPAVKERIMLSAHWDTRPKADEDLNAPNTPSDGANDGASGVGILIEIARQLSLNHPGLGIDLVLFDAEDGGDRHGSSESWCLGSQYWSKTPHVASYRAKFGILLDMVGAKNATFPMELHSLDFARDYVYLVWQTAQSLGYSSYFINEKGGHITDDHYYINTILGVRTLDIIHYNTQSQSGFGDYWHTHKDNMSVIDKNTLKAVGHTVIEVIYRQNNGS